MSARGLAVLAVLAILTIAPRATAQDLASALGRPSQTSVELEPADADGSDEEVAEDETEDEPAAPWVGPQIELGYGYLKLADGYGGGDAHFADLEVFIQLPLSEVRVGISAALGSRDYSLAGDDLIARAGVSLGFQLTELVDPFVPYVAVVGSVGALVGTRFDSTVAYALGGAGVELGGMLRLYQNLHVSVSVAYQRWEMDGAGFDVFVFSAALGL